MEENTKHTDKLLRLYNRLKSGPITIEVARAWTKNAGIYVSDRQLYRDLDKLEFLKINDTECVTVFKDGKNRKKWKLEFKESADKLTEYDINSFYLLKNFAPSSIVDHRTESI